MCPFVTKNRFLWIVHFRYFGIVRTIKPSRYSTLSMVQLQVALILTFSYIIQIPKYFEHNIKEVTCNGHKYVTIVSTDVVTNLLYQILYKNILNSLLITYIPLLMTVILTFRLVKFLPRKEKLRKHLLVPRERAKLKSDDTITTVLIVIAVIYITCLIPTALYPFLRLVLEINSCDSLFYFFAAFAETVAILNCALNFFVYYLNIPRFRRCLKGIFQNFCCSLQRTKINPLKSSVKVVVVTVASDLQIYD